MRANVSGLAAWGIGLYDYLGCCQLRVSLLFSRLFAQYLSEIASKHFNRSSTTARKNNSKVKINCSWYIEYWWWWWCQVYATVGFFPLVAIRRQIVHLKCRVLVLDHCVYCCLPSRQEKVKVASRLLSEFRVKKGVRQVCVVSPYLFNLFNIMAEMVMREVLDGWEGGVHIGGRRITSLRYAEDIVLLAGSEKNYMKTRNLYRNIYWVGLHSFHYYYCHCRHHLGLPLH